MADWLDWDLDRTIRDYEYTKLFVKKMNTVLDSEQFQNMDADAIFCYLSEQMDVVSFCDYLKRYIYEHFEIGGSFGRISDAQYYQIIDKALENNKVPYSFTPTKKRRVATIKDWLKKESVKRGTIFVIAFGLRMSLVDATSFLTKVLKEESFNMNNPKEVIYWYCICHQLPYDKAKELIELYESSTLQTEMTKELASQIFDEPEKILINEQLLLQYLGYLQVQKIYDQDMDRALLEYLLLYKKGQSVIASIYNRTGKKGCPETVWQAKHIKPADFESILCSGIPKTEEGNLQKMSFSSLGKHFQLQRVSRQRIAAIIKRKQVVHRMDILTLLFFIYAETIEPDWPAERFNLFIDEANKILERCKMMALYPVNPYDAFLLMCLLTDYPLEVYTEIWEKSYQQM